MVKIAAIDHEKEWLDIERNVTDQCFRNVEQYQFYEYSEAEGLLLGLTEEYFDVFLLDMDLPDGNGLKIARIVKRLYPDAVIIYVTNYVETAMESFDVNFYHYVPKKLLKEKLPRTYQALLGDQLDGVRPCFIIQNNSKREKIPEDQIYYLIKEKKYVKVIHKGGESKVRSSLEAVYRKLSPEDFVRVDKGCIVNLRYVMALEKRRVTLENGESCTVSQPQLANVKKRISEYWNMD